MAEKVKILIVSDCKVGGKHIPRGTTLDIDPDNAADKTNYGLLVHAGRVAEATEKNIAKVKAEIERDERIAAENEKRAKGVTGHEALVATLIQSLAAAGFKPSKA